MNFLYQPLTWGFFLVLVPLAIHLINLMRQKRVEWAAMEFLLKSYKKHRRWVWLKQFLLLLSRMALIAAAVAMLAHLVTRAQWTRFFGGKTTHHIVLLDDSYSMSDRAGSASAFEQARGVVTQLATLAMAEDSLQKFTLLRTSSATQARAAANPQSAPASNSNDDPRPTLPEIPSQLALGMVGEFADLNGVTVDGDFDVLLEEKQRNYDVSQLSIGPSDALNLAAELVEQLPDDRPVIYLVSDFRRLDWEKPMAELAAIKRLEKGGARVNLIQCVTNEHPNLGITDIRPIDATRAAGVPLFVEISVKNFGAEAALQTAVAVETVTYSNDQNVDDPMKRNGGVGELPNVLFDRIDAGQTVTRRVQVYFSTAGQHVVVATLPSDPVVADNRRWCVAELPESVPVLLIDGDPRGKNAAYLEAVFQPGERVQTGIRPQRQSETFLRDAPPGELRKYSSIFLLDVPQLSQLATRNLEDYVREGGGLAILLGPNSLADFYRRWSEPTEGSPGFFPVPVVRPELMPANNGGNADLIPTDHPIFKVLMGEGQLFAAALRFRGYFRVPSQWKPDDESTVQVLATLRNGNPLAVERSVGNGRVIAILTSVAPIWNNWATQPTFPVMMLEMQSYLDSWQAAKRSQFTGSPIQLQLESSQYQPRVDFLIPGRRSETPRQIAVEAKSEPLTTQTKDDRGGKGNSILSVTLDGQSAVGNTTAVAGVYTAWPRRLDGTWQPRRFVLNVDPREGNLTLATSEELANSLASSNVELFAADELSLAASDEGGFSWSQFLLASLVALLVGEQCLAMSASFHPRSKSLA